MDMGQVQKFIEDDEDLNLLQVPAGGEDDVVINPLLPPEISEFMFKWMRKRDLLSARLVCKDWAEIATLEYRGRDDALAMEDDVLKNEGTVDNFVDLMSSSHLMPVTRISFNVDLLLEHPDPKALVTFLKFCAPWVKTLEINFLLTHTPLKMGVAHFAQADEMRSHLEELNGLKFPELEKLKLTSKNNEEDLLLASEALHQVFAMAMLKLVKRLVVGAENLRSFECSVLFDDSEDREVQRYCNNGIAQLLPSSLKRLSFSADYEVLKLRDFQLQEFEESKMPELASEHFPEFLRRQIPTLRGMKFLQFENLFKGLYPAFPHFNFVTRLWMYAPYNTTFEFVKALPALVTLEIVYLNTDKATIRGLRNLAQHSQVRRLILLQFPVCRDGKRLNFELYSHVFPNLCHLECELDSNFGKLAELFIHLPELERLKLGWMSSDRVGPELKSFMCGVPPSVGLTNLKKLKILEIEGGSDHLKYILSKTVLHKAFNKLDGLKELRLHESSVDSWELDKAGEEVLEALRAKGIDVYRMKPHPPC